MAITEYVYSPDYPSNYKTITVDMDRRIPVGAGGDEKYILKFSTSAYSSVSSSTRISDIYMYHLRRGWAQSFIVSSPLDVSGGTLQIAIDEDDSGYISVDLPTGTLNCSTIASSLQDSIRATASGTGAKASATNRLSYLNAQVTYEEGRFTILSGSVKSEYIETSNWKDTSSVHVTGGTEKDTLGFSTGYPNSIDVATTASGSLHAPASALVTFDDAVRFGIESMINQIDFTG